ncbi:MAG TPA: M48 family metalloprotease [Opitutaceae bacterium]|nr:M48 family metalloprotease [Opitutaceae bacterium]
MTPSVAVPPVGLTAGNLNVDKETTYFVFVLLISIGIWGLVVLSIIGLFYGLLIALFLWFGNGLLIAYLRAEAVRVDERQLPELHAAFLEVCRQLGVTHPPRLYVLQSGGLLNAFATRFAGRDFVVVYSDFLEALGPGSPEMKFVLGHEIGHIKSRHILKQIFLAPGLLFPLVGPAYRRAWETSCDRYGAYAAQDMDGAIRAMLVLGGGREHGRRLDADAYASQHQSERGFFVSLHELVSDYPTLSRRVTDLLALKTGQPARRPGRNPLAYPIALLVPGANIGGGASGAMFMVVVIGLLAAMAIPAFQKVRQASVDKACANNHRMLAAAFEQFQLEQNREPQDIDEIVGPGKSMTAVPLCPLGGAYHVPAGASSSAEIVCTEHGTLEELMERALRSRAPSQPGY